MKKLIILSALIFLTACSVSTETTTKEDPAKKTEDLKAVSARIDTTSGIGEICGGEDKMKCHQGLSCIFDYDTEDGHGICAEKIINNEECENIYDPVCGLNDGRQKYTYFSECHMRRHGAELLNKGRCKFDENIAGNCEAKVMGHSNCFKTTTGYEFNGTECVKKIAASCGPAEVPFETQESCETACK